MATEISKLAVVLSANAGGMNAGLKTAGTAVTQLKAKTDGLTSALARGAATGAASAFVGGLMSAVAPMVGLGAAANFLKNAFKEFSESEKAIAQIEAAIKSSGNAAGFTSIQYQQMADALQEMTAFDDAETLGAMSRLLRFTNVVGEEFKRTIRAAQDLSVATGKDLNEATASLGKALNDPVNGLKLLRREGVLFNAQQKQMIRSMQQAGDVAGAQKIILDKLQATYGGSAAAFAGTVEGRIAQAKNAFGDLQKSLISDLAPALKETAVALKSISKLVGENDGNIRMLAASIGSSANLIHAAMVKLGLSEDTAAAEKQFENITAALAKSRGPIDALIASMEVLEESIGKTFESWQDQIDSSGMSDRAFEIQKMEKALAALQKQAEKTGVNSDDEIAGIQFGIEAMRVQDEILSRLEEEKKIRDQISKSMQDAQAAERRRMDAMTAAAERIKDDLLSPYEKLSEALKEINDLEAAGLLTMEQAAAASRRMADELISAELAEPKFAEPPQFREPAKVAALERRFTAGFPGQDTKPTLEQIRDLEKKNLKAAQETAKGVGKIVKDAFGPIVTLL